MGSCQTNQRTLCWRKIEKNTPFLATICAMLGIKQTEINPFHCSLLMDLTDIPVASTRKLHAQNIIHGSPTLKCLYFRLYFIVDVSFV